MQRKVLYEFHTDKLDTIFVYVYIFTRCSGACITSKKNTDSNSQAVKQ